MPVPLRITLLAFCLVLMASQSLPALATRENPLFDTYNIRIGTKAAKERLNNYSFQIKNAPGSRAVIVVYAESNATANSVRAHARWVARYLTKNRGIDVKRVVWRYEDACGHDEVRLYLFFPNEADPMRDTTCSGYGRPKPSKR